MTRVKKLNGQIEEFDKKKIEKSIRKANCKVGIAKKIANELEQFYSNKNIVSTDLIQNSIEIELMKEAPTIGKNYIIARMLKLDIRKNGWKMTDLQRDIFNSKYVDKDENFEKWVDRIGYNNEPIKKLIREKKFMPAGRILAGRRLFEQGRKITYSNCFVENMMITTSQGLKPIQSIQINEKVLTHNNRFRNVDNTLSRLYTGTLYMIELYDSFEKIICTNEHPFLSITGWKTAEELTTNDFLKIGYIESVIDSNKEDNENPSPYSNPLFKIKNNESYIKIKKIKKKEVTDINVYNLSVNEDNSYVVNGICTHNCYVLPKPEDSLESIFNTARDMAKTYSYGGGVGINISNLRPRGALVNNAAKNTSGAVSFMDLYSLTTGLIGQNGRRGALMINIDCTHPDLLEFLNVKNDLNRVTKANISVNITDEFMEAVKSDSDFKLYFEVKSTGEKIEKIVNARKLFRILAENNWNMAEPGILYKNRIDNYHIMDHDPEFEYAGVNP